MSDKNHCTFNVQRSSASDMVSCSSEDNKCRVRKMIEVTRSTRYTTFVDGGDELNNPDHLPVSAEANRKDLFSSNMAVMDSSLRSLNDVIGDDKHQFAAKCNGYADKYMERLNKVEKIVDECAKLAEKHQNFKTRMSAKRRQIKEKLQGVLEVSRKKRDTREKILMRLMKKMG